MNEQTTDDEEFVELLTSSQPLLRGYIMSSLADHADCQDVLQRTSLTLWRKREQFRAGSPFLPWAMGVAKYEILAFIRDRQRERVVFQNDVVELMVDVVPETAEGLEAQRRALHQCLESLHADQLELMRKRYIENLSLAELASATAKTTSATKSMLSRIRALLRECISRKLMASDN